MSSGRCVILYLYFLRKARKLLDKAEKSFLLFWKRAIADDKIFAETVFKSYLEYFERENLIFSNLFLLFTFARQAGIFASTKWV
ncbi:MAG: hypothetical protein SAL07_07410 [Oscillatoria sp. PMC 1051.18]|nr:hypothetical protein [Oscillatoria sp. PMC 1051.18]